MSCSQNKLIMLRGLMGSGKTTWAKNMVAQNPGTHRINKDDLRAMFHDGKHSKGNEKFVLAVRDGIVAEALNKGDDVIVDDTNFASKHENRLQELANQHNAEFEIVDFSDVPIEICIANDLKRPDSVGEGVIRQMAEQYGVGKETYTPQGNEPAIICDLDGTLAWHNGRSPYDTGRVDEDELNQPLADLMGKFATTHTVIILSGRNGAAWDKTVQWLEKLEVKYHYMFMRDSNDNRRDKIVKRELFDQHVRPYYDVKFVIDDRRQMIDLWREMGLQCWQVAEGRF